MFWQKRYFNSHDWIMENLGVLGLSSDQAVIVLTIDFLNRHNVAIIPMELAKRSGLSDSKVDDIIQSLVQMGILKITPSVDGFSFNIDAIYQDNLRYEYVDQDIFDVFESSLARPLSQREVERLNGWLSIYSQDEVIAALRIAIGLNKVNFSYINTVLANSRKEQFNG